MKDYNNEDDSALEEPPRHDVLSVRFRGDTESIVLPYCEVANGDVSKVDTVERHVLISKDEDTVTMTFEDFIKVIESTFDIKEVVQLSLQKAGSYENIQIL